MKKLILSGSALLLALASNAQTPGIFSTYAYDDFALTPYTGGTNNIGIYWYKGTGTAGSTDTRSAGKEVFHYATAEHVYMEANFGTSGGGARQSIDCTNGADIELDIENGNATKSLAMRVILKDVNDVYTEIEPNVSDCDLVSDYGIPLTTEASVDFYPEPGYNGFILPASTRQTIRIDLSSVATCIGGRVYDGANSDYSQPKYGPGSKVGTFDKSKVFLVQFQFNEGVNFNLTGSADDKGSYKFDYPIGAGGQTDWTGDITIRSFKIGSCLSALNDDPDPITAVNAEVVEKSLRVYPNPAKDVLNVSFETNEATTITLTDMMGNVVYTGTSVAGQNNVAVNTSNYTSGLYLLNISTDNGKVSRKITVR